MNRALFPSLLILGACTIDEPDTTVVESDLSAAQWQPTVAIPLESRQTPALTYWDNRLTMAAVTNDSPYHQEVYLSTFDGSSWSDAALTGLFVDDAPAIAVLGGDLYAAFPTHYELLIRRYVPDTNTWTTVASIRGWLHNVSLAVMGTKLYVASAERYSDGIRDRVVLDRIDTGTTTRLWSRLLNEHVYASATALASWSGQLHLLWSDGPGGVGSHPMRELVAVPGHTYVAQDVGMNSWGNISMTVCNGVVHLAHRGDSDNTKTWWSYRSATATSSWSANVRLSTPNSRTGASLGCNVYVVPTMVHDDSTWDSKLMYSEFQ